MEENMENREFLKQLLNEDMDAKILLEVGISYIGIDGIRNDNLKNIIIVPDARLKCLYAEEVFPIEQIAPFLDRLIKPRFDGNETNDYICDSTDCKKALEAYGFWRGKPHL